MVEQGQAQADVALPPRKRLLAGLKQQNGWIPGSSPSPSPSSTLQVPTTPAAAIDVVEELPVQVQAPPPPSPGQTPECSNCGARDSQEWRKMRLGDVSMLLCTLCGVRVLKKKYCPHCYIVYQEDVDLTDEAKWLACSTCKRRVHSACEERINGAVSCDKPFVCVDCSSDRPLPNRAVLTRARTSGGRQGANASNGSRGVSPRTEAVLGLRPSRPDHVDVIDLPPPTKKPRTASSRDVDGRSRDHRRARMEGMRTSVSFQYKKDIPSPLGSVGGLGYEHVNRQEPSGCHKGLMAPVPAALSSKGKVSSPPLPPVPAPPPPIPERNLLEAAAAAAKAAAESAVTAAAAAKATAIAKAAIAAKAAAAAKAALDVAAKAARSEVRARAILRKYGDRFERELHGSRRSGVAGGRRQEELDDVGRLEQAVKAETTIHGDTGGHTSLDEQEKVDLSRAGSVKEGGGGCENGSNAELASRNGQSSKEPASILGEEGRGVREPVDPQQAPAEIGREKVVKEERMEGHVGRESSGKRMREEKGVGRLREEKVRKRLREGGMEGRVGDERSAHQVDVLERKITWESKAVEAKKRVKYVPGGTRQSSDLKLEKQLPCKEPGERKPVIEEKCGKHGLQEARRELKQGKGVDKERKVMRDEGREKKAGLDEIQEKERKVVASNGESKSDKVNAREEKEKLVVKIDKGGEKGERKDKGVEREEKRPVLDKPKLKARREEKMEGTNSKELKPSKKSVSEDGRKVLKDVIIPGSVKASNPQSALPKATGIARQFSSNGGDGRSAVSSTGVQKSSSAVDDEELARQLHRAMNSSPRISGVDMPTRRRGRVEKHGLSKSASSSGQDERPQETCKESLSRSRCGLVRERSHIPGREVKRSESRISKSVGQNEEAVMQQALKDGPSVVTNGAEVDGEHAACVTKEKAVRKGLNGATGWLAASGGGIAAPDAVPIEVSGEQAAEENGPNAAMAALLNEVLKASPEEDVHLAESGRMSGRNFLEEKRKLSLNYVKKAPGMLDITTANGGMVEKVNGMNGSRGNGYCTAGMAEKAGAHGGKFMAEMKFKGAFSLGKLRPVAVGDVEAKVEGNTQSRTAGGPSPHYG